MSGPSPGADRAGSDRLPDIADELILIIQVPRGSAVERGLREDPPPAARGEGVLVQSGPTDAEGTLEPPIGGEVVFAVPGPEGLARQADDVRRVIREAGTGAAPLVIVVDAAEVLREEELAPVVEAAGHTQRPVILRVIRPSET